MEQCTFTDKFRFGDLFKWNIFRKIDRDVNECIERTLSKVSCNVLKIYIQYIQVYTRY